MSVPGESQSIIRIVIATLGECMDVGRLDKSRTLGGVTPIARQSTGEAVLGDHNDAKTGVSALCLVLGRLLPEGEISSPRLGR